ncbi:MAG TPA: response regulator transcription factor [Candidatus Acidoferrales bacterium]|nr:response regulator transcription factor [Candidatus Acidoferrales bacterium]
MVSNPGRIRVLVADDSPTALHSICTFLEMEGGFDIVGTASDGVNILQQAQTAAPDLVLMDIQMPRMNGLEVTRELRRAFPALPIILFSEISGTTLWAECIGRGASAFIHKSQMPEQLLREVWRLFPGYRKPE